MLLLQYLIELFVPICVEPYVPNWVTEQIFSSYSYLYLFVLSDLNWIKQQTIISDLISGRFQHRFLELSHVY